MKPHPSDDPLESRLRNDAKRVAAPLPLGLEGRIARAVARSGNQPGPARRPWLVWGSVLGATAGMAAALLLALRVNWKESAGPALLLGTEDRATSASLAESVQTMPAHLWDAVQPKAQAALQNDPLQKEANALYSDARSALGFLAFNFLPEGAVKSTRQN